MNPTRAYLVALGEAHSCLADSTTDVDQSARFDHWLIDLDIISGDVCPECSPMARTHAELLD